MNWIKKLEERAGDARARRRCAMSTCETRSIEQASKSQHEEWRAEDMKQLEEQAKLAADALLKEEGAPTVSYHFEEDDRRLRQVEGQRTRLRKERPLGRGEAADGGRAGAGRALQKHDERLARLSARHRGDGRGDGAGEALPGGRSQMRQSRYLDARGFGRRTWSWHGSTRRCRITACTRLLAGSVACFSKSCFCSPRGAPPVEQCYGWVVPGPCYGAITVGRPIVGAARVRVFHNSRPPSKLNRLVMLASVLPAAISKPKSSLQLRIRPTPVRSPLALATTSAAALPQASGIGLGRVLRLRGC